jgi:hypothetical protein
MIVAAEPFIDNLYLRRGLGRGCTLRLFKSGALESVPAGPVEELDLPDWGSIKRRSDNSSEY